MEKQSIREEKDAPQSGLFALTVAPHGAFGALATLRLTGQPPRRFTLQEASIVARAIDAVALGSSAERQIYMSPIASDQDFDGRVTPDGLVVGCEGAPEVRLSWSDATDLARELAAAGAAKE